MGFVSFPRRLRVIVLGVILLCFCLGLSGRMESNIFVEPPPAEAPIVLKPPLTTAVTPQTTQVETAAVTPQPTQVETTAVTPQTTQVETTVTSQTTQVETAAVTSQPTQVETAAVTSQPTQVETAAVTPQTTQVETTAVTPQTTQEKNATPVRFRGRLKQPPLSPSHRVSILSSFTSIPTHNYRTGGNASNTIPAAKEYSKDSHTEGVCIVMRVSHETGVAFTTNAERVRQLSSLAAAHVGGYKLLLTKSIWLAYKNTTTNMTTTNSSFAEPSLGGVLSRRRDVDGCRSVVFLGEHVILAPPSFDLVTSLLSSMARNDHSDIKSGALVFHSPVHTKLLDPRIVIFNTASEKSLPQPFSPSYLKLLSSTNDGELEMHLQRMLGTTDSSSLPSDIQIQNISSVLKTEGSGSDTRYPFEVAGMPRSQAECRALEMGVFNSFSPNASLLPLPCTIPSSPIVSVMSASQCWLGSCENSDTLFFPQSPDATVCIINSKGTGAKGMLFRPLNTLTWDYYTTKHGYKMHSYEPKGKDAYLHDRQRTKISALITSIQNPDCSWAMWSDDDTIVVNYEITLESIIQEFAPSVGTSVVGAWDQHSNVANSGNFFVRRSEAGAQFAIKFRKWLSLGFVAERKWKDNTDFIHLIETSEFSPITVISPNERFNSYFSTKVDDPRMYAFNGQTTLLLHYPGTFADSRWKAIPSCNLLQSTNVNLLLQDRNYSFCQGMPDLAECFTYHCRQYELKEQPIPQKERGYTTCVIQPPTHCGRTFLANGTGEDVPGCDDCEYIRLPSSTPCNGPLSIPTSLMSDLAPLCLWTIFPIPESSRGNVQPLPPLPFSLQSVVSRLTYNPASVVLGVDEIMMKGGEGGVASGFVAVKGDMWGNTFTKHIGLFHALQLTVPPLQDYYREVLYHVATSRQFMAVLDKVTA